MSKVSNALHALGTIWHHPLIKSGKVAAYKRWLRWQLGSRLVPGPVLVNFVNDTRLCLRPGMHGATMNLYVGLDEYQAMAFVLHFLRPPDLFVDVGANVGAFSVLASGAVGARSISFEPTPRAFADLSLNVKLNHLEGRVDCRQIALSNVRGEALFTRELDTLNHIVLSQGDGTDATIRVQASTLDEELALQCPVLIKMDAEGYESPILDGAEKTFRSTELQALVIEINENCHRYGLTEAQIYERIVRFGFVGVTYDPRRRILTRCNSWDTGRGSEANTIFVRNIDAAQQRLGAAARFQTVAYDI